MQTKAPQYMILVRPFTLLAAWRKCQIQPLVGTRWDVYAQSTVW